MSDFPDAHALLFTSTLKHRKAHFIGPMGWTALVTGASFVLAVILALG
jgi:hypothetical protein